MYENCQQIRIVVAYGNVKMTPNLGGISSFTHATQTISTTRKDDDSKLADPLPTENPPHSVHLEDVRNQSIPRESSPQSYSVPYHCHSVEPTGHLSSNSQERAAVTIDFDSKNGSCAVSSEDSDRGRTMLKTGARRDRGLTGQKRKLQLE